MERRRRPRVMIPVEEVDIGAVNYQPQLIDAPHLTGFWLRCFVWFIELWPFGPLILSILKRKNKYDQVLKETVIPERPMFRPEYPPQDKEPGVISIDENDHPSDHAESALSCLPPYDASKHYNIDSKYPFLYWTIRDYAHAYRSGFTTPSMVAEYIITVVDDCNKREPCMSFFIHFDADEVREQAAQSTQRITNGKPLSVLDGIFMPIKDDIDCKPYPTTGATTWYQEGPGSVRKEEERNEKIIRGLLKLPLNRRCINCNSLGPQYVCTNFWTFICITCSGIHREFTHRVKSVSMAKFTSKEVEELQRGGNQRARENFLKGFDMQQNQGFPNCTNVDQIREFVKNVYVEKKFLDGIKSSEKPSVDIDVVVRLLERIPEEQAPTIRIHRALHTRINMKIGDIESSSN